MSVAHGYHGVSLLRQFLSIGYEPATIRARVHKTPLVAGPGRNGGPVEEKMGTTNQTIAEFDFGDRFGIFDFSDAQYFSWIRSPRLLVRGEHGEINNNEVRYLLDFKSPITLDL